MVAGNGLGGRRGYVLKSRNNFLFRKISRLRKQCVSGEKHVRKVCAMSSRTLGVMMPSVQKLSRASTGTFHSLWCNSVKAAGT